MRKLGSLDLIQYVLKLRRRRRSEVQLFLRSRVSEAELLRMQKLPVQLGNLAPNSCVGNGLVATGAVNFVTYDRMLDPGKMYANLMSASGL